jgi:hypothetical protein
MNHQKNLILCVALVGIFGVAYLFIPQVRSLGWFGLVILACPLMHIWMSSGEDSRTMKDHDEHKH